MNSKNRGTDTCMVLVRLLQLSTLILNLSDSTRAQLTVNAITPSPSSDGSGNTIMGITGSTIASALLPPGTPALMWGMVPATSVIAVCQHIQMTGTYTISAHVTHNWNDSPYDLDITVTNTGGCLAAPDGSGTEIVSVDQNNRKTALVCLNDAGQNGCAVWVTGEDVNTIFNRGPGRRLLSTGVGRKLSGCAGGAVAGGIAGSVVGYPTGLVSCFLLYPTIVGPQICVAGVIIVSGAVGAVSGCKSSSCFPGDALVQLPGGIPVPMKELAVGDKVAVWRRKDDVIIYEDIYAFGHRSATAMGSFVRLTLERYALTTLPSNSSDFSPATRELDLTPLHFVPTAQIDLLGRLKVVQKRAQYIQVGDYVWAVDSNTSTTGDNLALFVVKDVSVTYKTGLFNPLTMSGTIMVSGVVASVHSEWFLDDIFDAFGMSSMLPAAYQLVLSPVRLLYRILGKQQYASLYQLLDNFLNVAEFGTVHGGKGFGFLTMVAMFCTLAVPWKVRNYFQGTGSTKSFNRIH